MGSQCLSASIANTEVYETNAPVRVTLRRKVEDFLINEGSTMDEQNYMSLDLKHFKFEPSDYEILATLSKLSALPVTVYKVKHRSSEEMFALKKFELKGRSPFEVSEMMKQVKLLSLAKSPHLVEFYGFFLDSDSVYILEELMERNLDELLQKPEEAKRLLTEDNMTRLFLSLVDCMHYLETKFKSSHNFVLCPKNVFFKGEVENIKISGFAASLIKKPLDASFSFLFSNYLKTQEQSFIAPEVEKIVSHSQTHSHHNENENLQIDWILARSFNIGMVILRALEPFLSESFRSSFTKLNEKEEELRRWTTISEYLLSFKISKEWREMMEFSPNKRLRLDAIANKFIYLHNKLDLGKDTTYIKRQSVYSLKAFKNIALIKDYKFRLINLFINLRRRVLKLEEVNLISKALASFTGLIELDINLNLCELNDSYMEIFGKSIQGLTRLEHLSLNLNWNKISDTGIAILSEKISQIKGIRFLGLFISGNELSGAAVSAVADMIAASKTSLEHLELDLSNIPIGENECEKLTSALGKVEKLCFLFIDFRSCGLNEKHLELIRSSIQHKNELRVMELRLGWNAFSKSFLLFSVSNNSLQSLRRLELDISCNNFQSNEIEGIANQIASLTQMKSLKMDLSGLKNIKSILTKLSVLNEITSLSLVIGAYGTTFADMQGLVYGMKKMKLECLDLNICLSEDGELSFILISSLIMTMAHLRKLSLLFRAADLGKEGFSALAKSFQNLENLEVLCLDLEWKKDSKYGLSELFLSIKKLSRLKKLKMNMTNRRNLPIEIQELKEFLDAIRKPTLKELKLQLAFNNIGNIGCKAIYDFMNTCSLTKLYLNLSSNRIGTKGLQILESFVRTLEQLNSLKINFRANKFNDRAATSFIDSIRKNPNLEFLKLNLRFIDDISEKKMAFLETQNEQKFQVFKLKY